MFSFVIHRVMHSGMTAGRMRSTVALSLYVASVISYASRPADPVTI